MEGRHDSAARQIRHNGGSPSRDGRKACEAYHCNGSRVLPNVRALDYVNRSAMKRAVIALVLALAALALLISLALESRSLPVETHVAQYTIAGDLERLNGDFRALVDTLESAWAEQAPPGEGARALLERVAAQPRQLPESLFSMQGSASQEARLSNSHETFMGAVGDATSLAEELIADQTTYAAAVSFLREEGAAVIQELRDAKLDRQAADTFQLVVGTLDFAGKDASVRAGALDRLLVTLGRDQRVDSMPGQVAVLLVLRRHDSEEQAAHRKQAEAARRLARRRSRRGARAPRLRTCTRSPSRASSRRG